MKILNFRNEVGMNSVLASFEIYLPALKMMIHNVKIVQSKNGKQFYSLPCYCIVDPQGQKKYFPVVSFSQEKKEEFTKSLREALKEFSIDI